MAHCISCSSGMSLRFETDEEYDAYKREELLLQLRHYKAMRDKYGIWADNQDKYVQDASMLKPWDSRYMEALLAAHSDLL